MKKRIISMILVLAMVFSMLPAIDITAIAETPWYTSGDGTTAEKAYVISTYDGLIAFAGVVNGGDTMEGKYIKLADNFGKGTGTAENLTTPIGKNSTYCFKGTFDGNGQNVVLAIGTEENKYAADYAGLFGYVYGGTVKNVSTSGAIYSSNSYVGGVVGYNNGGTVTNCYATGSVSGEDEEVGGVVGGNKGNVKNCYATSSISSEGDYVGGVAGDNFDGGTVTDCYCLNLYENNYGSALTDANMKATSGEDALVTKLNTYATGEGKAAGCKMWAIKDGVNNGYPYLVAVVEWYTAGDGEEATPYIISDYDGLKGFADAVNGGNDMSSKYIRLADDFGKGDGTAEALIIPIGKDSTNCFKGTFDGNGQTVVLAIGSQTTPYTADYAGLFSYVDGGTIKNVSTSGAIYSSNNRVGGVVGLNSSGTVSNCSATGTVKGNMDVGGVVGDNYGTVTNCYATGAVSSTANNVGGVVGANYNTVTNCYATGDISVTGICVGGVVGTSSGTVANCYATGTVNGLNNVGGVVGHSSNTVTNCYATGAVSGTHNVGGVAGYNGKTVINCYATGTVTGTGNNIGGVVGFNSSGTVTKCYCLDAASGGPANVIGSGSGTNCAALSAETMKLSSGDEALVTKLNNYISENGTSGMRYWVADGTNYPTIGDKCLAVINLTSGHAQDATDTVSYALDDQISLSIVSDKNNGVNNIVNYGTVFSGNQSASITVTAKEGYLITGITYIFDKDYNPTKSSANYNSQTSTSGIVNEGATSTFTGSRQTVTMYFGQMNLAVCLKEIKVTYAPEPDPDYLTFTAEQARSYIIVNWESADEGSVMIKPSAGVKVGEKTVTSTDWQPCTKRTVIILPDVGDSVQFKGINVKTSAANHFVMRAGKIAASGSVTSLTDGKGANPGVELAKSCYSFMFLDCTALVSAPKLPATTLAYLCYMQMFSGCTALVSAPELPATVLADCCYERMFSGCTSLVNVPLLEAEQLKIGCYRNMFNGCSKMVIKEGTGDDYIWKLPCASGITEPVLNMTYNTAAGSVAVETPSAAGSFRYYTVEPVPAYLTFTAEEAEATVSFGWKSADEGSVMIKPSDGVKVGDETVTSTDWQTYTAGTVITLPNEGDTVQFKGKNVKTSSVDGEHFTITDKKVAASGSVTSLTDGNGGNSDVTLDEYLYSNMFLDCTALVSAPTLPATHLATGCYKDMFVGCTSLVSVPTLPATKLAEGCYQQMFGGCKNLVSAPALPATQLAKSCYAGMFSGCTSLVSVPPLPATKLARSCYEQMFLECTALVNAPVLKAETLAERCYLDMFQGCTALVNVPVLKAETLENGCYRNMFSGCVRLVIKEGTEGDYTWKIPYTTADNTVKNMTKSTVNGSDTVKTAEAEGSYQYYKVTGAPASVKLTETNYYISMKAAITAAAEAEDVTGINNAKTVTLLEDVKENITVETGKYVILDLNDHVLSGDGTGSVITNSGTLTVKDSTMEGETKTGTTRYFTDNDTKCVHGIAIGEACTDCGTVAVKDGCFETLCTGGVPTGTEGVDYVKVTGGVITGGTGSKAGTALQGGGVRNSGKLEMSNVNIVGNSTVTKTGDGGGISSTGTGELTLTDCSVIGNAASGFGGGINNFSNMTLSGCIIRYNTAGQGGGIRTTANANKDNTVSMQNCTISYNTANNKGGGIYHNECTLTLKDCKVIGNKAAQGGGGIFLHNSRKDILSFDGDTKVTGNTVAEGGRGENIFLSEGETVIELGTNFTGSAGITLDAGTGTFTANGTAADVSKFTSDNLAYKVKFVKGDTTLDQTNPLYKDHLELVKFTVSELTALTNGITLEKSDMTREQAEAIVTDYCKGAPAKTTIVVYADSSTANQYQICWYASGEWAPLMDNTLNWILEQISDYDIYVIGTITEKTKVDLESTVSDVAYTGSAVTDPTATAKVGGNTVTLTKALSVTYYAASDEALENPLDTPVEVGDYQAVMKVAADEPDYYSDQLVKSFSITQVTNTVSGLRIDNWTVGETASQPSITSTLFGDNQVTYEYKAKGADDSTYKTDVPTEVGEYTLRATSTTDGKNYTAGSATVDFAIKEKSKSIIQIIVDYCTDNIIRPVVNFVKKLFGKK